MGERRSILLLCEDTRGHAGNVIQHIDALTRLSRHMVYRFNPVAHPAACAQLDLSEFDAVVIHYTLMVAAERQLPFVLANKIAGFRGLKVQFIQDEYRSVNAVTARMRELGIDVLFTCVPQPEREQIYGPRLPDTALITTLPGFVPDGLVGRRVPPPEERPLDVGYRGRELPYWLGRLAREKVEIGRGFVERAREYGLCYDISSSEEDRLYGEHWNRFLASCRATLGTESGASVIDFDGSIERDVSSYLARKPVATFEEVEREILAPHDGPLRIHVASPRLFEAAALRTAMIFFSGEYSGVIEPWKHYLPLEKDFSNFEQIVDGLRDAEVVESVTAAAYDDLVASGRYSLRTFVAEFDQVVEERGDQRASASKSHYRRARMRRTIPSWGTLSAFRMVGGKLLTPPVAASVVVRDRAVRRLALAGRLNPSLAGDLWRLAALRRCAGRSFHLTPSIEAGGKRLVLTSSARAPERRNAQIDLSPVLDEIIWNHSQIGQNIPLLGRTLLDVPIGTRVSGTYGFDALVALSRSSPDLVREALSPLLAETPARAGR